MLTRSNNPRNLRITQLTAIFLMTVSFKLPEVV